MKMMFTFLITVFSFLANAGITHDKVKIEITDKTITLTTEPGFHLNHKAPASAFFDTIKGKAQPSTKTEPKFVFNVPNGANKASLKFFVCDDAKTVCELHSQDVDIKVKMRGSSSVELNESTLKYLASNKKKVLKSQTQ